MRFTPCSLRFSAWSLSLFLLVGGSALAQTSAITPAAQASSPASVARKNPVEQPVQLIQVEDASVRIDEVRVGSETKSISVQPKGALPAYQVAPVSGQRSWKVLGF